MISTATCTCSCGYHLVLCCVHYLEDVRNTLGGNGCPQFILSSLHCVNLLNFPLIWLFHVWPSNSIISSVPYREIYSVHNMDSWSLPPSYKGRDMLVICVPSCAWFILTHCSQSMGCDGQPAPSSTGQPPLVTWRYVRGHTLNDGV